MGISIFMYILSFVLGMITGRIINIVAYKTVKGLNFFQRGDYCFICNNALEKASFAEFCRYLVTGRLCRYCDKPISKGFMLVEIFTGIIFVFSVGVFSFGYESIYVFGLSFTLICISLIDYDIMEIPDFLVLGIAFMGVVGVFVFPDISFVSRLIGVVIISVPMYLLNRFVKDAFGDGDILLIGACGLVLGWENTVLAMFIALLIGGLYAIFLAFSRKSQKGERISFGQYICLGTFVALLYGERLIDMYLGFF